MSEPDRIAALRNEATAWLQCANGQTIGWANLPSLPIDIVQRLLDRLAVVERERDDALSSPMAAGLLLSLKHECEAQHARAEHAEAALLTLQRHVRDWKPFPIQGVGMIPWTVAEQAYARYSQLYGKSQSLERLAERGGFGLAELGFLLRGYEKRQDSQEDDGDWKRACEFATKAILAALLPSLAEKE